MRLERFQPEWKRSCSDFASNLIHLGSFHDPARLILLWGGGGGIVRRWRIRWQQTRILQGPPEHRRYRLMH
jgi:hypothetical protein